MPFRNLSDYLARETANHLHQGVGSRVSSAFFYDSRRPAQMGALGGDYGVSFHDNGKSIDVIFEGNTRSMADVVDKLGKTLMVGKYEDVISSAKVSKRGDMAVVSLDMNHIPNSQGRVGNQEKLLYAVINVAVKPVLKEILYLHRNK
jgi:hypothetical protein